MSLFENDEYQWRETYFILFRESDRPAAADVERELRQLDSRYQVRDLRADQQGRFESLTLVSPDDYAAMDITLLAGEDVVQQTEELLPDLRLSAVTKQEKAALQKLPRCECRFEVYHFEQLTFVGGDEGEDDCLDPGALLIVMETLASLCAGTVIDPQANSIIG